MILNLEDHKKQILLNHIREYINSAGEQDITMQDIADHCKVAKGTLYNYFSSKEDLLLAVIQDMLEPFDKEVEKVYQDPTISPDKKLQEFIKIHIRFFIESRNLLQIHIRESRQSYTIFKKNQTPREKYMINHTNWFLSRCSSLIVEMFPNSNADMLAFMFHETLKSHLIYCLYTHKAVNIVSDPDYLFRFFMHGASQCTF